MREYIYIIFILAALLSSLTAFRQPALHYKIIAIVIAIDLVSEIWANLPFANHCSNTAVYNIAGLLEFILYAFYYRAILKYRWVQTIIPLYLAVLILIWFTNAPPIDKWNTPFSIIGAAVTIFLSIAYYYQMFTAERLVTLSTSFEFWIATATIIFFASTLSYYGMLHYLSDIFRPLARKGLNQLQIINSIFYSIVTYGFLCRINIGKSSRSSSPGS